MEQAISITGALLVLGAYAANQFAVLDRRDRVYNLLNLIGAVTLTVIAYRAGQWGFVLMEGVWAIVSVPPLLGRVPRG
jgi:hypothetical protein